MRDIPCSASFFARVTLGSISLRGNPKNKKLGDDISTEKAFAENTAACNTRCTVPWWADILVQETGRWTCKEAMMNPLQLAMKHE